MTRPTYPAGWWAFELVTCALYLASVVVDGRLTIEAFRNGDTTAWVSLIFFFIVTNFFYASAGATMLIRNRWGWFRTWTARDESLAYIAALALGPVLPLVLWYYETFDPSRAASLTFDTDITQPARFTTGAAADAANRAKLEARVVLSLSLRCDRHVDAHGGMYLHALAAVPKAILHVSLLRMNPSSSPSVISLQHLCVSLALLCVATKVYCFVDSRPIDWRYLTFKSAVACFDLGVLVYFLASANLERVASVVWSIVTCLWPSSSTAPIGSEPEDWPVAVPVTLGLMLAALFILTNTVSLMRATVPSPGATILFMPVYAVVMTGPVVVVLFIVQFSAVLPLLELPYGLSAQPVATWSCITLLCSFMHQGRTPADRWRRFSHVLVQQLELYRLTVAKRRDQSFPTGRFGDHDSLVASVAPRALHPLRFAYLPPSASLSVSPLQYQHQTPELWWRQWWRRINDHPSRLERLQSAAVCVGAALLVAWFVVGSVSMSLYPVRHAWATGLANLNAIQLTSLALSTASAVTVLVLLPDAAWAFWFTYVLSKFANTFASSQLSFSIGIVDAYFRVDVAKVLKRAIPIPVLPHDTTEEVAAFLGGRDLDMSLVDEAQWERLR